MRTMCDQVRVLENTFVNEDYNIIFKLGDDRPKTAFKLVLVGPEEKVVGIHTMVCVEGLGRMNMRGSRCRCNDKHKAE